METRLTVYELFITFFVISVRIHIIRGILGTPEDVIGIIKVFYSASGPGYISTESSTF